MTRKFPSKPQLTGKGVTDAATLTWGCVLVSTRCRFLLPCFCSCVSCLTVLPSPRTQSLTATELSQTIWSTLILPT